MSLFLVSPELSTDYPSTLFHKCMVDAGTIRERGYPPPRLPGGGGVEGLLCRGMELLGIQTRA